MKWIAVIVGLAVGNGFVFYIRWYLIQTNRMKTINVMILIIILVIALFTIDWLEMFKMALDEPYFIFSFLTGIFIGSIVIHISRHSSIFNRKIKTKI